MLAELESGDYNHRHSLQVAQGHHLKAVQPRYRCKTELRTQRGVFWMYCAQTHEQPMDDEPITVQAEVQLEPLYLQEHPISFAPGLEDCPQHMYQRDDVDHQGDFPATYTYNRFLS